MILNTVTAKLGKAHRGSFMLLIQNQRGRLTRALPTQVVEISGYYIFVGTYGDLITGAMMRMVYIHCSKEKLIRQSPCSVYFAFPFAAPTRGQWSNCFCLLSVRRPGIPDFFFVIFFVFCPDMLNDVFLLLLPRLSSAHNATLRMGMGIN